ncbi:hypothetical protein MSAN_01589700 [Mycena sanguinolenta]|uniref:Uncharacterized protein n=1 Tax=Mycena sanguinolenta TaxID=230812 RepID=A0A8H6Y2Q2_9AGAR|nr:hypothetical protein MSAN_01589700 [Mycena sanguinolenta]
MEFNMGVGRGRRCMRRPRRWRQGSEYPAANAVDFAPPPYVTEEPNSKPVYAPVRVLVFFTSFSFLVPPTSLLPFGSASLRMLTPRVAPRPPTAEHLLPRIRPLLARPPAAHVRTSSHGQSLSGDFTNAGNFSCRFRPPPT